MTTKSVVIDDQVQEIDNKVDVTDVDDVYVDDEIDDNVFIKYAKLILPHLGLVILSCFYVVSGAAVFYHLESKNELVTRENNLQIINDHASALLNKLSKLTSDNVTDWRLRASVEIDNLTELVFGTFDSPYDKVWQVNGTSDDDSSDLWTFNAAIFFALTLLTTIGYGNLVPVTFEGRLFCTFYALLGVPLILIAVADIGKFFADNITLLYCTYSKWMKARHLSTCRKHAVEQQNETNNNEIDSALDFGYSTIPAPLLLAILMGFVALGALLLSYLEGWYYFDAFYFSFITMTTVGFGDLVPENQQYILLDTLYIVVGLAITTMCIDLVGARYIERIHNFGRAFQDARVALVNVGGKMVKVGDLKKHASILHRKYSIKIPSESKSFASQFPNAFTPPEIKGIGFIDLATSLDSFKTNSGDETT